ncbi:hypothetical protein GCM10025734_83110 [Kitasatospora paranensis]
MQAARSLGRVDGYRHEALRLLNGLHLVVQREHWDNPVPASLVRGYIDRMEEAVREAG